MVGDEKRVDRPVIGISCNYRPHEGENGNFIIDRSYADAVFKSGGHPQIIPILPNEYIPNLLELYDGIVLSGGGGLLPHVKNMTELPGLYEQNPNRYQFESKLITLALKKHMPLLGICRGYQMINDCLGGTVVNLKSNRHLQENPGSTPSHDLHVEKDSILYKCFSTRKISVNSFHSQVINKVGKGLKVSAFSDDGFIEGIEGVDEHFILGVQFHPEFMLDKNEMFNIYKTFINSTIQYKRKK